MWPSYRSFEQEAAEAFPALSARTRNALFRSGFRTVLQVQRATDDELLGIRQFGEQALAEVRSAYPDVGVPNWVGEGVPA